MATRFLMMLAGSLAVFAFVVWPSVLAAQAPDLPPGLRVRVDAPGRGRVVGTLMSLERDTFVVASSATAWHRVHRREIRRLEVSEGESRTLGAMKGVLVGGLIPAMITMLTPKKAAKNLELTVAITGGVLAGGVGFALKTESWERVYPAREKSVPDRSPVR